MPGYPAAFWRAQSNGWVRRNVLAAVAAFVPGVTMPTDTLVGLSNASLLTDLAANNGGTRYVVSAANQTITNKTVKAYIRVDATSGTTTFRNCLITAAGLIPSTHSEGATPAGFVQLGLVENPGGATLVLEDCVIEPDFHQYYLNCLRPTGNVILRRCVLKGGCTDSINFASGSTATVYAEDCVIGPHAFCNVSYDQRNSTPPYWTHNDGVQIQSTGARFTGKNVTFIGRADHPKGDLSVLTGTSGYADSSWGAALTYSGGTGLTAPPFDIDRGWFLRTAVQSQSGITNGGIVGTIKNSFVSFADAHLYGSDSMYHFRSGPGTYWDLQNTVWSAACGPLSRSLNGTVYTQTEGGLLVAATSGMTSLQKTLAGYRPDNL